MRILKDPIISHSPFATAKILRYFKTDNTTGFKDIVHQSINENDPNYLITLRKKLEEHPIYVYAFKRKKVPNFNPIQNEARQAIAQLISSFINYYDKHGNNPFGEDKYFTEKAQIFKRNYRFGWNSDEATDLRLLILKIIHSQKHSASGSIYSFDNQTKFSTDQIIWIEKEARFNIVANFFTWVPAIKMALSYFIQSILQHSNINGDREFDIKSKRIEISLTWEDNFIFQNQKMVRRILSIKDVDSKPNSTAEQIFQSIKNTNLVEHSLKNICNFSIEADFQNSSKALILLETAHPDGRIIELDKPVGGFIYKLEFIDLN